MDDVEYAGLRVRIGASLIDVFLILILVLPLLIFMFGLEQALRPSGLGLALYYLISGLVVTLFWQSESATLGKIATRTKIVDAQTGGAPSSMQFSVRYLAYAVSFLPGFLGFLWIALDRRKQGWHDKLAGTLVVRSTVTGPVEIPQRMLNLGLEGASPTGAELTSR